MARSYKTCFALVAGILLFHSMSRQGAGFVASTLQQPRIAVTSLEAAGDDMDFGDLPTPAPPKKEEKLSQEEVRRRRKILDQMNSDDNVAVGVGVGGVVAVGLGFLVSLYYAQTQDLRNSAPPPPKVQAVYKTFQAGGEEAKIS
eukprot:CAMPEP_0197660086 /NCGR_PEP_ID=MMETSP1338-20131121/50380_1 /TAXON_ID=43686 ORGANISM="Pelagodinium beii, Strain RCC1491" /NCGR_SAMPLE_ID=MMETSP1338 /ASSEMBLY_ACC=CAM_ASM_000754 /LENGTH=143 /DNA_ID=CAMNT_0043237331 /DNA_START=41 /DNA_END=472 /DNA_ORIENTATION=-